MTFKNSVNDFVSSISTSHTKGDELEPPGYERVLYNVHSGLELSSFQTSVKNELLTRAGVF